MNANARSAGVVELRQAMKKYGVGACIIPSADPHLSEYPSEHWKAREWLSGFNGSAGTLVVTENSAGLWTDSRYYLQADAQLKNTEIKLFKDGLPETPSFTKWLAGNLPEGSKIAVDGKCVSTEQWREWEQIISITDLDLISEIWTDRPPLPEATFFNLDIKYSGRSVEEKLTDLRAEMRRKKADICLLTALDDIAWLLNIRACNAQYNPVVTAFVVVEMERVILALLNPPEGGKLLAPDCSLSFGEGWGEVTDYNEIYSYFSSLKNNTSASLSNRPACLIDVSKTNFSLYKTVSEQCKIIETVSPVSLAKCIKNGTEIAGFRKAMERDGVAMLKFLRWLENALENGGKITEIAVAEKLLSFRKKQDLFFCESFQTIAGYGANGAIVHYSATAESNATLKPEGFLLLDSGGQYFDGTTDITRSIALGTPTNRQKRDFTLVLKGHIALASARFPEGTQGIQLDAIARKPLWDNDLNYGHGTGHGVGHFLCVHEYPPAVSPKPRFDFAQRPTGLQAAMVLSNEPGVYREGEYGIRTENLLLVTTSPNPSEGGQQFLCFETLTLCPIDVRAIDFDLLTGEEKMWLKNYHQTVFDRLSPYLNEEEKIWLGGKIEKK